MAALVQVVAGGGWHGGAWPVWLAFWLVVAAALVWLVVRRRGSGGPGSGGPREVRAAGTAQRTSSPSALPAATSRARSTASVSRSSERSPTKPHRDPSRPHRAAVRSRAPSVPFGLRRPASGSAPGRRCPSGRVAARARACDPDRGARWPDRGRSRSVGSPVAATRHKHLVLILARELASNLATPTLHRRRRGHARLLQRGGRGGRRRRVRGGRRDADGRMDGELRPANGSTSEPLPAGATAGAGSPSTSGARTRALPHHEPRRRRPRRGRDRVPALRARGRVRRHHRDLLADVGRAACA